MLDVFKKIGKRLAPYTTHLWITGLVLLALYVAIAGWGEALGVDPAFRESVVGFGRWVWEGVLFLAALATRDSDGDGVSDMNDPKPNDPTVFAMLLAAGLTLGALSSSACGSALETATKVSGAARSLQSATVQAITHVIEQDAEDQCGDIVEETTRNECIDRVLVGYEGVETATKVSAELLDALALALYGWARKVLAGELDEDEPPRLVCQLTSEAIDQVLRLAADHDVSPGLLGRLDIDLGCTEEEL